MHVASPSSGSHPTQSLDSVPPYVDLDKGISKGFERQVRVSAGLRFALTHRPQYVSSTSWLTVLV